MRSSISEGEVYRLCAQHKETALLLLCHRAGLFEFTTHPRTVSEVAVKLGWIAWKTRITLNALVALRLLEEQSEHMIVNAAVTDSLLTRGGEKYFGSYLEVLLHQWNVWSIGEEVLKSTAEVPGQQNLASLDSPHFTDIFQKAMSESCVDNLRFAERLDIWPSVRRVIDIGGGHGKHLVQLASANPLLTGEIWDLASCKRIAEDGIREAALSGRLTFVAISIPDRLPTDPRPADVVMIIHTLHHFPLDVAKALLKQSQQWLSPHGVLLIVDSVLDSSGSSPAANALFSFDLMINNQTAMIHNTDVLVDALTAFNFQVSSETLGDAGEEVALIARRSGGQGL